MGTKKCQYCKQPIDKAATVCPHCQRKQTSGCLIGCLAVILCAGLAFILFSVFLSNVFSDGGSERADIVSVNSDSNTDTNGGSAEEDAVPTIEEQVLWEADGITITAKGIDKTSLWGAAVDVLVENHSDKDCGISVDNVIVNDYMIQNLDGFTVTAGNKKNSSIDLYRSELKAAGIENIGKIELYMHTYDTESYETLQESGCITITTSDAAAEDTAVNITGTTLYEQNGIKIVGTYVDENSFWGQAILFYIENNSGQDIVVTTDDTAVNGYMISDYLSKTVFSGKKAIGRVYVYQPELEKNGITSVENVQTTFRILDTNYSEIGNSGKVDFAVKQ